MPSLSLLSVSRPPSSCHSDAKLPCSQAIIIGHSMGNLVARYFLERMGGADVSLMHVAVAPPFKVRARSQN